MSKEYSFSVMPSVSISRSRFARNSQHKTSFNLGKIVPIYVDEVLPGDTSSLDMASLVRMSTPIAPIMDNIYIDYFAFFVPNRLVWDHWKEFMGENSVSAGIPSVQYTIPGIDCNAMNTILADSVLAYMGLPIGLNPLNGGSGYKIPISSLPLRGYCLIYQEWFRDQNLIAPVPINHGDTDGALISYSGFDDTGFPLFNAAKLSDYFTRALPYAQKGAPVSIPLGTTAPVIVSNSLSSGDTLTIDSQYIATTQKTQLLATDSSSNTSLLDVDLSLATAATINQLRYAFQLQKLLEKDALYGSRYFEILAAHFGVRSPDARLQRPEYLGGFRQRVNVDQVLSTTGYDDSSTTDLGKPGANSVTGSKNSLFTKSFVEHGYVFILAVARHDQTYCQGINRMWSRQSRYDFYFPVFANLGAQEIRLREIFASGSSADDNIFGYQESWAEYRYKPSISSGLLSTVAPGSLDYWTLTNKFASAPTLGQTFIEQGRDNIQRALSTGSGGPDFIADFYFENICVRPMPMYSIPGLIDHH